MIETSSPRGQFPNFRAFDPTVASWLGGATAEPAQAWSRLRTAVVRVRGSGIAAATAARVLADIGVEVTLDGAGANPGDAVLTAGPEDAVAVRVRGATAFATPLVPAGEIPDLLRAISTRLDWGTGGPTPPGLAVAVGAAAAHRLACALAGLPDPASPAGVERAWSAQYPSVLVAQSHPLSLRYHPWLPAAPAGTAPSTMEAVTSRVDALTDAGLGALPVPVVDTLPQQPVALASCGDVTGYGPGTDAARVDAVLRRATALLSTRESAASGAQLCVGVHPAHAIGQALRRNADAAVDAMGAAGVPDAQWAAGSATARRWWTALTLRLRQPARLLVRRLAPDAVHARITVDGQVVAFAVEASAADAVAFAALAATGRAQAGAGGLGVGLEPTLLTGALPYATPTGAAWPAGWSWPAGVDSAEERLQAALRSLDLPPVSLVAAPDTVLGRALAAAGFAIARRAR